MLIERKREQLLDAIPERYPGGCLRIFRAAPPAVQLLWGALFLVAVSSGAVRAEPEGKTSAAGPERNGEVKTQSELIEAFIDAFNKRDVDAIMAFFTPDAVYHNMPGPPIEGAEAIAGVIGAYVGMAEKIDWEILKMAEVGSTVLTERIDRFVIAGKEVALPVMGSFDIRDGKIEAWRDYFDMATWSRQTSK